MSSNGTSSILVVSADPERVQWVTDALRTSGHEIAVEQRGSAASTRLGEGESAVLVVDLAFPELDMQRLREALGEAAPAPEPLDAVERRQIAAMLRHTGGNRRKAAQLLGLARSTLLAKIRRYGLESTAAHVEV